MLLDWYLNQYLHVFPALEKLSNTGNDKIKNLVWDKEGLDGIFVAVVLNSISSIFWRLFIVVFKRKQLLQPGCLNAGLISNLTQIQSGYF